MSPTQKNVFRFTMHEPWELPTPVLGTDSLLGVRSSLQPQRNLVEQSLPVTSPFEGPFTRPQKGRPQAAQAI